MHGDNIVIDIGLAMVSATALAYVARFLRQPLLLAYVAAGILIGPPVLGLVHNQHEIAQIGDLGLAFLMFIIGLEIDLRRLLGSGRVGLIAGTAQVVLTTIVVTLVMTLLGYKGIDGLYLGLAAAFSSTMIVVKLLSDRGQLDTVDGRLTLGILLVQNVLAIVVLALQPSFKNPELVDILISLVSGFALVAGSFLTSRYVLPSLFRWVSNTPELILITAITWCLVVGYLAILANFSVAMGALVAGITLSAFPYSLDVVARIRTLRDFFVTLFFVALGMQLEITSSHVVWIAVALSALVIASRFLVIGPTLYFLGYGTRVGTLCSLATAQAGEFALVIASVGLTLHHITAEVASVTALAVVITTTITTYTMMSNHAIARRAVEFFKGLGISEQRRPHLGSHAMPTDMEPDVVLLGFHRAASSFLYEHQDLIDDRKLLVVDFSPETQAKLRQLGVPCVYGDISNFDTLKNVGLQKAKLVISTVSEDFLRGTNNLDILLQVKRLNPSARVIVSAESLERAHTLYAAGADFVVLPRIEVGQAYLEIIDAFENGALDDLRSRALNDLAAREEVMA